MRIFQSRNPFTLQVLKDYPFATDAEVTAVVDRSAQAFRSWKQESTQARANKVGELGRLMTSRKTELAQLITQEMGKPITQAMLEVGKCADFCAYYSENAVQLLAPLEYQVPGYRLMQVQFEPLGPLLLIVPFNFPLWMMIKASVLHLVAGNTVVLKPAENTPGCAEALAALTREAGFGDAFQQALLSVEPIHQCIANPLIRGVNVTGSVRAGREVAATAGRWLKKCVLELGGSDPFLVLGDADVKKAAKAATARLIASGQVCIAPKRFIVVQEVAAQFTEALLSELRDIRVSDPTENTCKLGPLAREDLVTTLAAQVEDAVRLGAQVALGGEWHDCIFQPTVLTNVTDEMRVMQEETFGPVFPIRSVSTEAETIRVANESCFGLGSVVFCGEERASSIVGQIEAGLVFVNDSVKSIPAVPIGGVKDSGYGREFGILGIREFTNAKTVAVVSSS